MATFNKEWLSQNSQRNYPFKENLVLSPSNEPSLSIPNYVVVDLVLTMPADGSERVYLSDMLLVGDFLTFMFRDSSDTLITSLTINHTQHKMYTGYNLVGTTDDYLDVRGKLVLGDLSSIREDLGEGSYSFTLSTAEFEACTIRPDLRGVRNIIVTSPTGDSEPIMGRVRLTAGSNVVLSYDVENNAIIIGANSPPDGSYNQPCACNDYLNPPAIKSINGIAIEDVVITGDGKCVEVNVDGNKLQITNTCSEPCCGCTELEFIKATMDKVEDNLSKLESYKTQLSQRLEQFIASALLSS